MSIFLVRKLDGTHVYVEADKNWEQDINDLLEGNVDISSYSQANRWAWVATTLSAIRSSIGTNEPRSLFRHCSEVAYNVSVLPRLRKEVADDISEYKLLMRLINMRNSLNTAIEAFQSLGFYEEHECAYGHLKQVGVDCSTNADVQLVNGSTKHWMCTEHAEKYVKSTSTEFKIQRPSRILDFLDV